MHGELGWDDPIPDEAHRAWEILLTEFLSFPVITVPRSVRPVVGVGLPELFAFFDGSLEAFACCIYVRWILAGDNKQAPAYQVRLLAGKARVTPLKGSTASRSELSRLLILSRLLKVVVEALWEKPTSVTIAGDSQCTIATPEKSGGLLAPYFANQVSEIVRNMKEVSETVEGGDVLHLAGPLNPADLPTRETCSADDLNPDSEWMSGPAFLYKSRAEMPMSRKFLDKAYDLPPDELRPKKVTLLPPSLRRGRTSSRPWCSASWTC